MTYIICILSGVLTALPLIVDNLWFLSWISMIPFIYILVSKKPKFRHGLAFSAGYYFAIYTWFWSFYPLKFLGLNNAESIGLIFVCWIGLSTLQAAGTSFISLIFKAVKGKRIIIYPFAMASAWTILEYIQELTWMGVPFCRLAISQASRPEMLQSASLLGSLFVGFLIVLVNSFFAISIQKVVSSSSELSNSKKEKSRIKINKYALIALLIILITYISGLVSLLTFNDIENAKIKFGVVQPNIDCTDVEQDYSAMENCRIHCELTEELLENQDVDIVLWPEGAATCSLKTATPVVNKISDLAKKYQIEIIVGAYDSDQDEDGYNIYNSLFLFHKDGSLSSDVYHKQKLVPFGEYLPMRDFFTVVLPILTTMNTLSTDMSSGDDPSLLTSDYGLLGGLVCFDSIYEELARNASNTGAEVLLVSSNDGWFKDSAATKIHKNHSILRAIENGKYVIRSARTGISCIINPKGNVIDSLGVYEKGYFSAEISLINEKTVYTQIGNIIVPICGVFLCSLLVIKLVSKKKLKVS